LPVSSDDVKVTRLGLEESRDLPRVNSLFKQLSTRSKDLDITQYRDLLRQPNQAVVGRRNGIIVGFGLVIMTKQATGVVYQIGDIVVDETESNQGLGTQLVEQLKQLVPAGGYIQLISAPQWNNEGFYQKLGFTKKGSTDIYYMVKS
jgi:ribosomal protein S18 acetylase RimI-like enzyme